jgi:hypothetical protein
VSKHVTKPNFETHGGLVLSVDLLVSEQPRRRNLRHGNARFIHRYDHQLPKLPPTICFRAQISNTHRRLGHAIPNKQNDIFHQRLLTRLPNRPPSDRLLSIVILQRRRILARLRQGQRSVRFTRDVDFRRGLGVECKEVFVPSEIPLLDGSIRGLEEIGDRGRIALVVGDLEREVFVGDTVVESFGAVDGCVDLSGLDVRGKLVELTLRMDESGRESRRCCVLR